MTGGGLEWTILPSNPNTHFESLAHSSVLLNGLNELRCCDKLLDISLVVEGQKFKAHRAVLAACSDYFRAMFTDAMKEAKQSEIYLKGVTAKGIELLIKYAYTSRLEINRNNVQDILSAASYVQMDAVVGACSNYLENQIDLENCVDIVTIADIYSLEKLKEKTYKFMCSRLKEFSLSSEINRFTWEQFEHLLGCDYPVDCSEATVLHIVLHWIVARDVDIEITQKLLQRVRFTKIQPAELDRTMRPFCAVGNKIYYSAKMILSKQKFLLHPQNSNALIEEMGTDEDVLTNSRGMELALVKIGGFGIEGITNKITYYLPSRKKWHNLTVIPHVEQCNYGSTVLGNDLYVVGGCYNVCLKEYIHPFGFRYCPTKNRWNTIAPMQQDRCRFSLNAIDNCLYAVGGVSEINENEEAFWPQDAHVSNCERYNANTDMWEYIPALTENRTQHAGCAYKRSLYISGGLDRQRILSSFWRFNICHEQWEELPSMLTPRADHVMLVIWDKLYVCGGWYEDLNTETRNLAETIDVFDFVTKTWQVETTVPTAKYHAGIVAVSGKIYVIGGLHSDAIFDRASSVIQCYDLETKMWNNLERYPQNIWECTCVTLYVPRCREDLEVMVDKEESSS